MVVGDRVKILSGTYEGMTGCIKEIAGTKAQVEIDIMKPITVPIDFRRLRKTGDACREKGIKNGQQHKEI